MGLPVEGEHLTGALLTVSLFGLYTCIVVQSFYYLKRAIDQSIWIYGQITVLWALTLGSTVLQASIVYDAFVASEGSLSAAEYYATWYMGWKFIALTTLFYITLLVGNMSICWRLYVLWRHNWRVLAPLLILFFAVTTFIFLSIAYHYKSRSDARFWALDLALHKAKGALTLTTHLCMLALMCGKIWQVSKWAITDNRRTFRDKIDILIESGGLYVVAVLLSTVMQSINAFDMRSITLSYLLPQTIALVSTLVLSRFHVVIQALEGRSSQFPPVSLQPPVFAAVTPDPTVVNITTTTSTTTSAGAIQLKEKRFSIYNKAPHISDNKASSQIVEVLDEVDESDVSRKGYHSDLDLDRKETID
ncbi:hypothetical protein FRC03_010270 [Tulasnella sp. 419]|nr:hypothetical protein FRC02_003853 [Tulasnella sp. 418]KAG8957315.1 hypothetical protein FRC03_010270 [Tulasnella sp. 419]